MLNTNLTLVKRSIYHLAIECSCGLLPGQYYCSRCVNIYLSFYYIGRVANLISKFVIGFTLSNILFDLWSVEKPYPYPKYRGKQGYSSILNHLLMRNSASHDAIYSKESTNVIFSHVKA